MKNLKVIIMFLSIIFIFPEVTAAQNIKVYSMIGKSRREIIHLYGRPIHIDNSNPEMVCLFYKIKNSNLVFVGDKSGIYEANARIYYATRYDAVKILNRLIKSSLSMKFTIDTLSANDFQINKVGVTASIQLYKADSPKKYEISIKANSSD